MAKIDIDGLAQAIADNLMEYSDGVAEKTNVAAKKAAKTAAKSAKAGSPRKSGKYAAGGTSKTVHESPTEIRTAAFNKNKPQLTHLLEKGHATAGGTGRVPGRPHIAPAEKEAIAEFEKDVEAAIRGN